MEVFPSNVHQTLSYHRVTKQNMWVDLVQLKNILNISYIHDGETNMCIHNVYMLLV